MTHESIEETLAEKNKWLDDRINSVDKVYRTSTANSDTSVFYSIPEGTEVDSNWREERVKKEQAESKHNSFVQGLQDRIKELEDKNRGRHSFITDEEEAEAIKLVEESFMMPLPRVCGWKLFIALYQRGEKHIGADGKESSILLAETVTGEDKYRNCSGLVVGMGELAYQDKKKFPLGPWCKIGDFVSFPRHAGHLLRYIGPAASREESVKHFPDGRPVMVIPDDAVMSILEGPDDVGLF